MTELGTTGVDRSDAELIAAVRAGDTESYGILFDRHRVAATRLARQLVPGPDADDLVAESFVKVLTVLQAGKGPDEAFRAYLLTAVRRLHIDRVRDQRRVRTTDDEAELDRAVELVDPSERRFEQTAAAQAYASLPERWQLVLWHLDVEGQKPAEVAPLLQMSANSVSALAYRAREGLRQAYLQSHLSPSLHASCRRTTGLLGAYVRRGLSARDTARVESHLDECSRCTGLALELSEVNSDLAGVLGPAVLGTAAGGYLAGSAAVAGGTAAGLAGVGSAAGAKGLVGTVAEAALAPLKVAGGAVAAAGTQGVATAAVVVSVAAGGTVAVTTSDFGTTVREEASRSRVVATEATPAPMPPSAPEPTDPVPTVPVTTEPEPTVEVPVVEPAVETPPEPTVEPPVETTAEPEPVEPDPRPTPTVEPVAPTDFAVSSVRITNDDTLLQRRLTIGIGATYDGTPAARSVTIDIAFDQPVVFRGVVSEGWSCGTAVRNQSLRVLSCTRELPPGEGTTFITKAIGLSPRGTITVTAPDDPVIANDSAGFQSGLWPLS